jgi:plasmid stabilization system protein ParE
MTRYTVTWLQSALDELARLWTEALDRQAVADAADRIDVLLGTNPLMQGQELSEGLRSLDLPPLHVLFTVREDDRLVEVSSVRTDQPPPSPTQNGPHSPPHDSV